MENKQLTEVLQQGLQDEMNSAFQYIALAGRHGDVAIKQAFCGMPRRNYSMRRSCWVCWNNRRWK